MTRERKLLQPVIIALICALVLAFVPNFATTAADKYTYKKVDQSQIVEGTNHKIEVVKYYKRAVLNGSTDAIKKINKKLKKMSDKELANDNGIVDTAKDNVDAFDYDDTYYCYTDQKVEFMNKKVVSISTTSVWYAGGVNNTTESGVTYDLKTGKQIKSIIKVTKEKSLAKIKKTLKKKIEKDDANYDTSELDSMKATDFNYYIKKNGNVVVCFGPYELGFGGWSKCYVIKGKYNK